jgi:hypothetical protein
LFLAQIRQFLDRHGCDRAASVAILRVANCGKIRANVMAKPSPPKKKKIKKRKEKKRKKLQVTNAQLSTQCIRAERHA